MIILEIIFIEILEEEEVEIEAEIETEKEEAHLEEEVLEEIIEEDLDLVQATEEDTKGAEIEQDPDQDQGIEIDIIIEVTVEDIGDIKSIFCYYNIFSII